MKGRLWMVLMMVFILPGLLATVSCAPKGRKGPTGPEPYDQAAPQRPQRQEPVRPDGPEAGAIDEEELARRRAEEDRRRDMQASREAFLNEHIYFPYDSSELSPRAQTQLRNKADWLRKNPGLTAIIEGHCDERGTTEYNLALGDRRAESVKSFLVNLGIAPTRLLTISYGEERPIDPGHSEAAWAKNRRAQFVFE
ncbi:MAG: peptidoglycan-associated lipoprotein Pal [Thermodesulfobacteriota bacterium]